MRFATLKHIYFTLVHALIVKCDIINSYSCSIGAIVIAYDVYDWTHCQLRMKFCCIESLNQFFRIIRVLHFQV